MVIITIIVDKNDQVINFREPIGESPQHMRLLSCSLHTTWYNLKRPAEIKILEDDNAKVKTLPARNYSLETLGRALEEVFKNEKINFRFDHVEPAIFISNPLQLKIQMDRDLVVSLGLIKYGIIEKPRKLRKSKLSSLETYSDRRRKQRKKHGHAALKYLCKMTMKCNIHSKGSFCRRPV